MLIYKLIRTYRLGVGYDGFISNQRIKAIATGLPTLMTNVPSLVDPKDVFKGLFNCKSNTVAIAVTLVKIIALNSEQLHQQCAVNLKAADQCFGIQHGLNHYFGLYKINGG